MGEPTFGPIVYEDTVDFIAAEVERLYPTGTPERERFDDLAKAFTLFLALVDATELQPSPTTSQTTGETSE